MERIKTSEISNFLKKELENFDANLVEGVEYGEVLQIGDGIAKISGLKGAMMSEMLSFSNGSVGMVLNLLEDHVGAVLFGSSDGIVEGTEVRRLGKLVSVPVGNEVVGRVLDPLGVPVDGGGPLETKESRSIEVKATGIMSRKGVQEPMQTGIKVIDSLVPIGRGQRELIMGDRQTGKTSIAIDTILNQKGTGMKCIYVAMGQKQSNIAAMVSKLRNSGAMEYTTIVMAPAYYPSPYQFIAPYAGVAMAEYFMLRGEHVLIVYDDLTKHAQAYRELSLLLERPPGREAFPGDVFYLHSRLLERAAKLSDELGGGSITALPIVETQAGDISAYIPTNVISITDGQIFLNTELFNSGQRPAMDIGMSVSRVGGSAQTKLIKKAVGSMKPDLQQYLEVKIFSQFASDLDDATKRQLTRGEKLMMMLRQKNNSPMSVVDQSIVLFAATRGYLDKVDTDRVAEFEEKLVQHVHVSYPELYRELEKKSSLDEKDEESLKEAVKRFAEGFN